MVESIECQSRIERVVVYARGAVVTRRVELPVGLPPEGVDLLIAGVTPLAQPGSIRTYVDGERRITGLQAPLVRPQVVPATPDAAAIKRLERELRRVGERRERIRRRVSNLEGIDLSTSFTPDDDQPAPDAKARAATTLEMSDTLHELLTRYDAEASKLEDEARRIRADLDAARSVAVVTRDNQPERRLIISLAPGSEHLRALEVSYNVAAARWWPAYSARLSNGGKQAEFAAEAFVAQNTLESWVDVKLSLCTADMISDITLPELQSLRLGRAQPARATGFREPPEGLDAMFKGHDEAFGAHQPALRSSSVDHKGPIDPQDEFKVYSSYDAREGAPEESEAPPGPPSGAAMQQVPPMPASAPQRMKKGRAAPKDASRSGAMRKEVADSYDEMAEMDDVAIGSDFGAGAAAPVAMAEPEPSGVAVGDDWLDFDALQLPPSDDRGRRGRLEISTAPTDTRGGNLLGQLERLQGPNGAADPLHTRGIFDHQFDADGLLEIPASGKAHRVGLLSQAAKSRMVMRCVPLEDERVFREVEIENPLAAPLLPGPVDVFMDGALLITSAVNQTDVGGLLRIGLGEEQRLRVARNVRAREESKGVFKGGTAMQHDVTFEVASSLGTDIVLELVDRIPVTRDKELEIKLVSSEPAAEKYLQHDRDRHVDGGLRWLLPVKAGGTAAARLTYLISFDKDFEIVGGNRRA
jgi:hypothetical protein